MFISSCQAGQNVQHWVCQALVGGVHTRQLTAPPRPCVFRVHNARQLPPDY